MTGEMFAILRDHSLIGSEMGGEASVGSDFMAGVRAAQDGNLLARLFGVRAAAILGARGRGEAASFVSGLLIGSDCRAQMSGFDGPVHLLADGFLGDAYAAAIIDLGGRAVRIDSHASFIAGIARIREMTR